MNAPNGSPPALGSGEPSMSMNRIRPRRRIRSRQTLTRIRSNQAWKPAGSRSELERGPGPQERLLGRVLGLGGVAQEQAGQPIGAIELADRQRPEACLGRLAGAPAVRRP